MSFRLKIRIAIAIGLFSALSACATVKPYERENLADRIMEFEANEEEAAMEQHFLLTREGSIGGHGGAGRQARVPGEADVPDLVGGEAPEGGRGQGKGQALRPPQPPQ